MNNINAEVSCKESKATRFFMIRYWIVELVIIFGGLIQGSSFIEGGPETLSDEMIIAWGRWKDIIFYTCYHVTGQDELVREIRYNNIVLFVVLSAVTAVLPFVIVPVVNKIREYVCEKTSFSLSYGKVSGSCLKKDFDFSIEDVDNIIISQNIIDKLLTGKTLVLSAKSDKIKVHCVQNADEVLNAVNEATKISK